MDISTMTIFVKGRIYPPPLFSSMSLVAASTTSRMKIIEGQSASLESEFVYQSCSISSIRARLSVHNLCRLHPHRRYVRGYRDFLFHE